MSPKIFFLVQDRGKFISGFGHDNLQNQAAQVWNKLEGLTPILLLISVIIGIVLAFYYYKPYNEQPGRHYKVSHWTMWGLIATGFTLFATFLIEFFCIKTNLRTGLTSLYIMTAISNAIYSALFYLFISIIWCYAIPTNAYRFFKL